MDELKSTMHAMGAMPSKKDIEETFSRYDTDHDGKLDFMEVLAMLNEPKTDEDGQRVNLFRYEEESFLEEIRQELMPIYLIEKENEEDEAREHLPGGLIAKKMFDYFVVSGNRAELTDAHRGGRKWAIYFFMSMYMGISTFYIILFGFCHGQATTLDWLWGLLSQTLLSAFVVRPMQIFVFRGVLPSVIISVGIHFQRRRKNCEGRAEREEAVALAGLNMMLSNPMISSASSEQNTRKRTIHWSNC